MTDNVSEISESRASQSGAPDDDNTPGSLLRRAREEAGLSLQELSRRLCMTGNKLELLERDEYDLLPSALYVRGYIRNICKELKIDEGPVLQAYSGYAAAEEESQAILAHVSRTAVVDEGRRRSFKGLALLPLLIVAGVFWWMNGRNLTPPSFTADNAVAAPAVSAAAADEKADLTAAATADSESGMAAAVPSDIESVDEAPVESAVIETGAEAGEASTAPDAKPVEPANVAMDSPDADAAVAEPVEAAKPTAVEASAAETAANESAVAEPEVEPAQPAAAPEKLELSFTEESWVEVKDASGKLLMAKLQPAGAEVTLEGQAPFSVMLGNAVGTQVSFRGELVDSAPIGSRRTRRLTVGE
ncbi:RodZ domain-containing protein [Microbulbifer hainanensis]|uniref:RodZ domain-containing protein n=1 Tax=Microbulbifer hainanensis TaxID=2735675 RepID=UPI0018693EA9|nr:RodZ domain-containing protein [Microbulbifer hainanensis]